MPGSYSTLGHDLSQVRVHETGASNALGAAAYTGGSDIHFGAGQYDPSAAGGSPLLGHELAHVAQQRQGRANPADIQAAVGHYAR